MKQAVATAIVLALLGVADRAQQRTAPVTPTSVLLAVDRLLANRWYPRDARADITQAADQQTLSSALASNDPTIRRLAVRSLGRFENPLDVPTLVAFLSDTSSDVAMEAANAIAQALKDTHGADAVKVVKDLQLRPNPGTGEALASLHYDPPTPHEIAELLAAPLLVRLVRADESITLSLLKRETLRTLAHPLRGTPDPDALEILMRLHLDDEARMWDVAHFRCQDRSADISCGWKPRLVVAQYLDPLLPSQSGILDFLRHDPAYPVRIVALHQLARLIPMTKSCAPFTDVMRDSAELPIVVLEAMRQLSTECDDPLEAEWIRMRLNEIARTLPSMTTRSAWQIPALALELLPRFDPIAASKLAPSVLTVEPWQARASVVHMLVALKDDERLMKLAEDREENVRIEVVNGLVALRSPHTTETALRLLEGAGYHLTRAITLALKGTKETVPAAEALIAALARVTKDQSDTSRDVRLAIFERLLDLARVKNGSASVLAPYVDGNVRAYLEDFDPMVVQSAAALIQFITGESPETHVKRRPPMQPTESELLSPTTTATILLEGGDQIPLDLLFNDAPVTVARFVRLARSGFYDGTTFHRVTPLLVAQAGSPMANDDSGTNRFIRDEIGLERHTRGSVGMVTEGRDTGNGQFFIDLIDQPGFDRQYTVFARVQSPKLVMPGRKTGLAAVDALLEGSKIIRITLR